MSRKLIKLSHKIYNEPQLMTYTAFDTVVNYLESRNLEEVEFSPNLAIEGPRYQNSLSDLNYNPDTKVGMLGIDGPLTYIPHTAMCQGEASSYQRILSDATLMFEAGAKVLVLDADSPGGQAYGMMETATDLRNLADTYGAKLITYADGLIASAMYGIAATSHEIIINPEGEAGSIGVVVSLANYSEAEKKFGVKRTFITAGESKVPFDADGEFTKEFKDDIQLKVDRLYDKFTTHVAQYRNLSQEAVKSLGAKVYVAEDAVEKGLVDRVMTREQFFSYLADVVEEKSESMSLFKTNTKTKEKDNTNMSVDLNQVAELETSLKQLQSQFETATTKLSAAEAQLTEALAKLAALEEEKVQAKTSARNAKLEAAVGTVKAPALSKSLASLSDEDFEVALSMFSAKADDLDDKEVGAQGAEIDPNEDLTAKLMAQKYNKGAK